MKQQLGQIAILVKDYDEAIGFYTKVLDFDLIEDTVMSQTKRWVRVCPPGSSCQLLLAKAANEVQESQIGHQAGGRVFLFLYTDDSGVTIENTFQEVWNFSGNRPRNPMESSQFSGIFMGIFGI